MDRRSFLKRIAAVAAGAVAVTAAIKFRLNPIQHDILYTWEINHIRGTYDGYQPPSKPSKHPDYELGTRYYASNGTIYKYVKLTKNLIGKRYANCGRCSRTDLHDHTRCTTQP